MRFEWFVARRYLTGAHRGRAFISTLGVTIGVAVLICVISVMNGFEKEFLGKMLGAFGHLRLIPIDPMVGRTPLVGYEEWIPRFTKNSGVLGVSPVIEQGAMIVTESDSDRAPQAQFVQFRSIEPKYEQEASVLVDAVIAGNLKWLEAKQDIAAATDAGLIDPFTIQAEIPPIFVGFELAKELFRGRTDWLWPRDKEFVQRFFDSQVLGRRVRLVVPEFKRGPNPGDLTYFDAEVVGVFKTGFYDFDLRFALTSLEFGRILKNLSPGEVEYLEVRLDSPAPEHTLAVGQEMVLDASEEYGGQFFPYPWMELNPVLLQAVAIEKIVMGAILTLVVLVAAFGIASTLFMTVLEKTREIGTLMALGTRRRAVMAIFILNGFQVGLFGTLFGVLLGLGICETIAVLQLPMPGGGGVYVLDTIPVEIRWAHVLVISLFAMGASVVAGIYPAWKASKLHPVEALRYE